MTSIGDRSLKGVLWLLVGQSGGLIRLLSVAILARMISPEAFGVFTLASAILLILLDISDLGLAATLIQKDDPTREDFSTVFWMNLGLGIFVAILLWLCADIIASWFRQPLLATVLRAMAILLPLINLSTISIVLLWRQLRFSQFATREIASEIAFGAVGIGLAVQGMGIWALVGAFSAQMITLAVVPWLAQPWYPAFTFSRAALAEASGFGISALGVRMTSRVMAQLDYFLVGRYLGAASLGYYNIAFQLAVTPAQRLGSVLTRVGFPSFSLIKDDLPRMRKGIASIIQALALILIPFSVFMVVLAPSLIPLLYTEKWAPAVHPAQILALAALGYGFDVSQSVLFAAGKPKWRWLVLVLRTTIFVGAFFAFAKRFDIVGVAASVTISVLITSLMSIYALVRVVKIEWLALIKPLIWPAFAALVAVLPAIVVNRIWEPPTSSWIWLIAAGGSAATIYLLLLLARYRRQLPQIRAWTYSLISKG